MRGRDRIGAVALLLLFTSVVSGCGGTSEPHNTKAAPEYAATPRKALESWVSAVREGDIEMMCRLLHPLRAVAVGEPPQPLDCSRSVVENKLLPHVRAEMQGLTGELHYGAIDIGAPEARIVIGVVTGQSPFAYAVVVRRGKTQWSIKEEPSLGGFPQIVLERPDPSAAPLAKGRTPIAFSAQAWDAGSNYPNAALWIDGRHVNGRLDIHPAHPLPAPPEDPDLFGMEAVRWVGGAKLIPGRHVMVAAVKGDGGIVRTSSWVLDVQWENGSESLHREKPASQSASSITIGQGPWQK
jgi:hypothetical protein